MRRLVAVIGLAFLGVLGLIASETNAEDVRTWTDKSGKFSVDAEFVEITAGKVRLKLKDGKVVALSLAKLGEADRLYVRDLLKKRRDEAAAAESPVETPGDAGPAWATGAGAAEAPRWKVGDRVQYKDGFQYVPATVVGVDKDGYRVEIHFDAKPKTETESVVASWVQPLSPTVAAAAAWSWNPPVMKKPVLADLSTVKQLTINPSASKTLAADPAPPVASGEPIAPVRFGGKFGYYEKFLTLDFSLGATPLGVTAYTGGKDMFDVSSRVQITDLTTSSVKGNYSGPAKLAVVHLSPSGKRLATKCEPSETWGPELVDIWDVSESGLTHVASWQPYSGEGAHSQSISSMKWLDDARLITTGGEGSLVLWQADSGKAIYEMTLGSDIAYSPGGKQFAIATAKGIDIYSIETGAHFAHLPSLVVPSQVAFSPSGRRLALVGQLGCEIIDVTGAEASRQFFMGNTVSFRWLDEQFLLATDGLVVDSTNTTATWRYSQLGPSWLKEGRYWYTVGGEDASTLINIALPHDAAKQAAASLVKVQDLYSVAPGMAVTLDVDLGDPSATSEATAILTKALQAAGLRVEAGQPILLTARTRARENEETTYGEGVMFGSLRPGQKGETISVPTRFYDVEMTVNGQKVWSASSHQRAPGSLHVEEGDTIQSTLSREMVVKAHYVDQSIPMRIVKAEYQQPRGESVLTERGVEEPGAAGAMPAVRRGRGFPGGRGARGLGGRGR